MILLRLLSALVGRLPDRALRGLARFAAALVFGVVGYRRRVIAENLARAFPERTPAERAALAREVGVHLALSLLEFLKIPRYAKDGYAGRFRVEGFEHYEAARAAGKGVLVLTGHLGSFELGAGAIAQRLDGVPLWLVVKSFPPAVDRFVTGVRAATNLRVIRAEGATKEILKALRRNEAVAFVLDQNATRHIGVFVDFFGTQACTMAGLAVLALRTGAPVLPVSIWREAEGHVLRVFPAIEVEEREVVALTQRYTRFIEDQIRAHPAQWLWSHRRFKTRPDDEGTATGA